MENLKRVTNLPVGAPIESAQQPLNPARDLQKFVGEVMSVVTKPIDLANLGVAKLTQGLADALPSFPAARLFRDVVLGWPHSHPHAPTFGLPLPSFGAVICAGATNVLINGLQAARNGDVGFGAWCGGYYPLFEVFTGSSNVFIGGSRAARQFVDFTRHCLPEKPGWKAMIERWQYNFPEFNEYRIRADYLAVEKRFVADGVLDEDELQRLEEHCSSDKASERERKFVLPKIKGVRAVARGDEAALNRAIADLVEAHKWEAALGKYFLRYEGFICLPGMMLAQLGLERKMSVTVKSDYLPLRLLYQMETPELFKPAAYSAGRSEKSYELLFSIFVNTTPDLEELSASLNRALTGSGELRWQSSFDWSGNLVEAWPNEDFDESLASHPEEGFLYFRYRIGVFPIDEDKSVDRQVNIAKHLKTTLESLGGAAVICADFEDLL